MITKSEIFSFPTKWFYILCGLAVHAASMSIASADQFGDFTYTDNGVSITITDYPDTAVGAVAIPDTIVSKPVTSIGTNAFAFCTGLTSVEIPSSVTSIGSQAFYNCTGLTSITIPDGVKVIGSSLFNGCTGLTSVSLPSGITSIGGSAFENCSGLSSVTIPSTTPATPWTIGNFAFIRCSSLTSITLPAGLTSIGKSAFAECRNLTSVNIPSTVTAINIFAFTKCSSLQSIAIPPNVTTVGSGIFEFCTSLSSVSLPANLTTIGASAFRYCGALGSITIPPNVTNIGDTAFSTCGLLTTATFEGNAPTILMGTNVFQAAAASFRIYYQPAATGFTSPIWNGYTAIMIGFEPPLFTWLFSYGLSATSNLSSDSNGDGVSLLMAYALGLNPNHNLSGSMPKPVFEANQMKLSFRPGAVGVVNYVVETSTDLQHWSTEGVSISDADGIRTATVPRDGTNRFMRLSVSN